MPSQLAPGLPPYGLWKSTDGGANFTLLNYQDVCLNPTLPGSAGIIQASFGSTRGVHETALDPAHRVIVYAAPFPQNNAIPLNTEGGVWRSTDSGANWTQIKNALNAAQNTDRASFAVTPITGGFTRMYVGDGNDRGLPDIGGNQRGCTARTMQCRDQREFHRPDGAAAGVHGAEPNDQLLRTSGRWLNAGTIMSFILHPGNPMSFIWAVRSTLHQLRL